MTTVEESKAQRAGAYQRPLNYTFEPSLGERGEFRYVFDEGGLRCSEVAHAERPICNVSRTEMSTIGQLHPSFVYLDHGCWVDNADGNGTKRRDFGLVCGANVYLCEMAHGAVARSKVPSVDRFFRGLQRAGIGVNVVGYSPMLAPLSDKTPSDPNLYLLLGDVHLPPVSWFYRTSDLVWTSRILDRTPPSWMLELPALQQQPNFRMRNYYSAAQRDREPGRERVAQGPIAGQPDISVEAGTDLVRFLDGISSLEPELKGLLHFIQTGDLLELWLGRDYQFDAGDHEPGWADPEAPRRVADFALEVLIQNTPVFEALRRLESAGLSEVKYIWGNHDAYLMHKSVTNALGLPARDPVYEGLNGDLFVEHGHRFDSPNHDNNTGSGPTGANLSYWIPVIRQAEPMARVLTSIGHPSTMRDVHVLGATLIYLNERLDLKQHPFGVYAMGHTHDRKLFRFDIRTKYSLHGVP